MAFTGSFQTEAFPDRSPNRQCWLLFRAGPLSRLQQFQKGKMYMNSVKFFSEMKGEEATALRADFLEKNYLTLKSQLNGRQVGEFFAVIDGKEVSLGAEAVLNVDLPDPSNIFIFCMAALADGLDGRVPGELAGKVALSNRFTELGDHVLLVNKPVEFSKRLNAAIASHPYLYSSTFFEGGYGQVDYVDMDVHNGIVGLFRKDKEYAWQREYRFCIGCRSEGLNADGALELEIGDLSDITTIVPVDHFASQTFTLKRGVIETVDGVARHRYTD